MPRTPALLLITIFQGSRRICCEEGRAEEPPPQTARPIAFFPSGFEEELPRGKTSGADSVFRTCRNEDMDSLLQRECCSWLALVVFGFKDPLGLGTQFVFVTLLQSPLKCTMEKFESSIEEH